MLIVDFSKSQSLGYIIADTSQQKYEIAVQLREKLYELILSDGEVFEQEYLSLYALFANLELPIDARFEPFITLAKTQLKESLTYNESAERAVLIELATISTILYGKPEEALIGYIRDISSMHLADAIFIKRAPFSLSLFTRFNIPFEQVYPAFVQAFDVESMLALSSVSRLSVFAWTLHQWWNVPSFFNHLKWAELYPLWRSLFYRCLEEDFEFSVYLQFFIYHFMGNSYHTSEQWKNFNDEITKKSEPYFIEYAKQLKPCKKDMAQGKKLIGILRDRIVLNAPGKVEYSLLKALLQDPSIKSKFDFKLYLMGFIEKSSDDEHFIQDYKDLGVGVVDVVSAVHKTAQIPFYSSHLKRALAIRESIIADGVDILISPNNGYGVSDFLLSARSAPMQIYWSHGNAMYDLQAIDKRISHFQPKGSDFHFQQITIPMDIDRFYNPPVTEEALFVEKSRYPKNKVVLGVIGRLVKIDSLEYLSVIADVLHHNPDTIFIAAGDGNKNSIREKLDTLNVPENRFFMPGHVDPHLYGHIIDIFCNTFPLVQGESLSEFIHKGKAWISLADDGYYQQYCEENFDESLQNLKYSEKRLLYIQNPQDYKPDLKNWNELLNQPDTIVLCSTKNHALFANLPLGQGELLACELSEESLQILADVCLYIIDGGLHSKAVFHFFAPKPNRHLLYAYKFDEFNTKLYTQHIPKYPDVFDGECGEGIFFCTWAYTHDTYKAYLTKLIHTTKLRNQIADAIKLMMEIVYKEQQQICIDDFLKICP